MKILWVATNLPVFRDMAQFGLDRALGFGACLTLLRAWLGGLDAVLVEGLGFRGTFHACAPGLQHIQDNISEKVNLLQQKAGHEDVSGDWYQVVDAARPSERHDLLNNICKIRSYTKHSTE